jgi:glycosyltransferase involved in cell wall biosynthesis
MLRACCQAVTAVSDEEAKSVRQVIGGDSPPVVVVPNGVDVAQFRRGGSGVPVVPGRLLYNGALSYGPNREAVCWFAREVLPAVVARVPEAHLVVTGRHDNVVDIEELRANPRIRLTGFLPDLRPALDASLLAVVPLRRGGGTRLKILEAFAAGLPVVSTTCGARGIHAASGRHLLLADTPDDIAGAVVRLLQRPDEAASLAREARRLVEEHYDWPAIASGLSDLLERVAAR